MEQCVEDGHAVHGLAAEQGEENGIEPDRQGSGAQHSTTRLRPTTRWGPSNTHIRSGCMKLMAWATGRGHERLRTKRGLDDPGPDALISWAGFKAPLTDRWCCESHRLKVRSGKIERKVVHIALVHRFNA